MSERRRGEPAPEVMGHTTRGAAWEWGQSWFLLFFLTFFLYWVPLVYMGLRVLEVRWVLYGLFYAAPVALLGLVVGAGGIDPDIVRNLWKATGGFFLMAGIHTLRARGEFLLTVSEAQYAREELRTRERQHSGQTVIGDRDGDGIPDAPARLLNANRLSETEFAMLPGMGPERAQQAIRLRKELGDYLSFADFAAKLQLSAAVQGRMRRLFEPDSEEVAIAVSKDDPAYRQMADGSYLLEVNWASVEALAKLPGLGPELAQRAVTMRDGDGPFKSVEDLRFRLGLSMDALVKLSPLISVTSMSRGPRAAPKAKGGGRIVDV